MCQGDVVLPLSDLRSALADCAREVRWTPAHAGAILCVPLTDEGTSGGVTVPGYKQRHKFQGLVVAVNKTKDVVVGDLINFDMGRGEEIRTYAGETYFHVTEDNASGIDEEFRAKLEAAEAAAAAPKEQQLASGLWIATDAPA